MGADFVTLDTLISFASFGLDEPGRIVFADFDEAAADAGYELRELTLLLPGHALRERCERCASDVWWLQLDGIDQRIELRGEPSITGPGRYTLELHDWGGDHPRADVSGWQPAG
ncbi:MAG: hypothetical protein DRQ55_12490 [Planctomycetota bacterium]|nr:MAG: hypothetical protein DRQ55_12490 [Planctomycetota bacterium]